MTTRTRCQRSHYFTLAFSFFKTTIICISSVSVINDYAEIKSTSTTTWTPDHIQVYVISDHAYIVYEYIWLYYDHIREYVIILGPYMSICDYILTIYIQYDYMWLCSFMTMFEYMWLYSIMTIYVIRVYVIILWRYTSICNYISFGLSIGY